MPGNAKQVVQWLSWPPRRWKARVLPGQRKSSLEVCCPNVHQSQSVRSKIVEPHHFYAKRLWRLHRGGVKTSLDDNVNGILNTGLGFWQLLLLSIIAIVFGVVAIRISFKFDVNKFLESRHESNRQKLKSACTHMQLTPIEDGRVEARSHFISPPGTPQWQCQRCGLITYSEGGEFERDAKYYLNNLDHYTKKNKRFNKLLKKSGMV